MTRMVINAIFCYTDLHFSRFGSPCIFLHGYFKIISMRKRNENFSYFLCVSFIASTAGGSSRFFSVR